MRTPMLNFNVDAAGLGVVRIVRTNRSVQRQEAYELQISGVDSPREEHEDLFSLIEDD